MAIAPSFRSPSGWLRRGIPQSRNRRRHSRRTRLGLRVSAGRSHRWWTLLAMHAGVGFRKEPARILISGPRWLGPRCADSRAWVSGPTAWEHVSNASRDTERQKEAETTTGRTFRKN